jgi:hypothetical protein
LKRCKLLGLLSKPQRGDILVAIQGGCVLKPQRGDISLFMASIKISPRWGFDISDAYSLPKYRHAVA